ncbi:hypothetical protein FRB93_014007 [Tulasnella sp. JGI-2019a]|nr:hypothetical protein FRB93_014007 [Tulasnella sp. JGI-2019a]
MRLTTPTSIVFLVIPYISITALAAPLPTSTPNADSTDAHYQHQTGNEQPSTADELFTIASNQGGSSIPPGKNWRRSTSSVNNSNTSETTYIPSRKPIAYTTKPKKAINKNSNSKSDSESAKTTIENAQILRGGTGGVSVPPGMHWRSKRSPCGGGTGVPPAKGWSHLAPSKSRKEGNVNVGAHGTASHHGGKGKVEEAVESRRDSSVGSGSNGSHGSEDGRKGEYEHEAVPRQDDATAWLDAVVEEQSMSPVRYY